MFVVGGPVVGVGIDSFVIILHEKNHICDVSVTVSVAVVNTSNRRECFWKIEI